MLGLRVAQSGEDSLHLVRAAFTQHLTHRCWELGREIAPQPSVDHLLGTGSDHDEIPDSITARAQQEECGALRVVCAQDLLPAGDGDARDVESGTGDRTGHFVDR